MIEFTASVRNWLESDSNNVIAVHCKGKLVFVRFHLEKQIMVHHYTFRRKRTDGYNDLRLACGGRTVSKGRGFFSVLWVAQN